MTKRYFDDRKRICDRVLAEASVTTDVVIDVFLPDAWDAAFNLIGEAHFTNAGIFILGLTKLNRVKAAAKGESGAAAAGALGIVGGLVSGGMAAFSASTASGSTS